MIVTTLKEAFQRYNIGNVGKTACMSMLNVSLTPPPPPTLVASSYTGQN